MSAPAAQSTLDDAAGTIALDADAVRARLDAVLNDDLYWFPVRHHSPAVAHRLQRAILQRRPKLILIEGPSEANELIPHLIDPQTKPPVAIYCSYRDDNNVLGLAEPADTGRQTPFRAACWYPLLEYSPEYVAIQAAKKVGAEAVFIDLPYHALAGRNVANASCPPSGCDKDPPRSGNLEREDDRLIVESAFYQQLAATAGFRTWDEAWDALFEFNPHLDDVETFRRELATFCAAARASSHPARIAADGTPERERFMRRAIDEALAARDISRAEALVVCGGFHLFLDRDDPTPPPVPPEGTLYTSIVPFSFFRVSELSDYAAGNRAPQFYQLAWDAQRGKLPDLVSEYIVSALKRGRRRGEAFSSADAIAASQHAGMLAALRNRPVPVLDDLHDALVTCCCKGNPAEDAVHLLRAIDEVDIGTRIGRVTTALGRLPIVNDFYALLQTHDFEEVVERERRVSFDLDRRNPPDARRSVFLHRLRFLEVPLAELTAAPTADFATGLVFREKWALRWSPKVEPALIEQNLYGDTLETAALARLTEQLADDVQHAGKTCRRLVQAVDLDLPGLVDRARQLCGEVLDVDTRFTSLSQALGSLIYLERHAAYREAERASIDELVVRCFNRACFAIADVVAAPEEEQAEVVQALLSVADIVLRGDNPQIDRELFAQHVKHAAAVTPVPFLRGAFLGLLAELRVIRAEDLAAAVSALAGSAQAELVHAGDLLDGIIAAARTSVLLGAKPLVQAVDQLLRAAEWESFLVLLPRTRAAFERLHERMRLSIAQTVAELYGLKAAESIVELRTSAAAAAHIAEIDRRVAEIISRFDI